MVPSNVDGFAQLRNVLYAAVVADVLDSLGFRDQVLSIALPCVSGGGVLIGRAKTTQWVETDEIDPRPYELELKAVDECNVGDVLVAAAGGSMRSGVWGELLSTAARNRGCLGAIVDGAVRDLAKMHAMDFRVFARGACPRDSLHRQRVVAIDVNVEIGGVTIVPGDILVADIDGVVVVPKAIEREALAKALEKVNAENQVRDAIRSGRGATEVFRQYGVL